MKKSVKFIIVFLITSSFLIGCTGSENILQDEKVIANPNERVVFSSFEEFNKKIDELSSYDNDRLQLWVKQNNSKSLLASVNLKQNIDEQLINLPNAYKAILNDDSEFAINDKVIWLHHGNLYEIDENENIAMLKENVAELEPVGQITMKINGTSDDQLQLKSNIGQNQLDARHQYGFYGYNYLDCSNNSHAINALFKYVHELMTVQTTYYASGGSSKLYLRVKLEWKGKRWNQAGEPRDIDINLNLSGTTLKFANGRIVPVNGSDSVNLYYSCSGDQTILLKSSDGYGREAGDPSWSVEVSGTINHQLHGGYYAWTNYAVW